MWLFWSPFSDPNGHIPRLQQSPWLTGPFLMSVVSSLQFKDEGDHIWQNCMTLWEDRNWISSHGLSGKTKIPLVGYSWSWLATSFNYHQWHRVILSFHLLSKLVVGQAVCPWWSIWRPSFVKRIEVCNCLGSSHSLCDMRKYNFISQNCLSSIHPAAFVKLLNDMRTGHVNEKHCRLLQDLSRPVTYDDGIVPTEL